MSIHPQHHIEQIAFQHHADLVESGRRSAQARAGDQSPTTRRTSTGHHRRSPWIAAGAALIALLTAGTAYATSDRGETPTAPTPVVSGGGASTSLQIK